MKEYNNKNNEYEDKPPWKLEFNSFIFIYLFKINIIGFISLYINRHSFIKLIISREGIFMGVSKLSTSWKVKSKFNCNLN